MRTINATPITDEALFLELIHAVAYIRCTDDEIWVKYGIDISRDACRRERTCVLYDDHRGDCL